MVAFNIILHKFGSLGQLVIDYFKSQHRPPGYMWVCAIFGAFSNFWAHCEHGLGIYAIFGLCEHILCTCVF